MTASAKFAPAELERVSAEVAKAEAATSGEIVPVILPASDDYSWVPSTLGLRVALLTLLFVEVLNLFSWPITWPNTLGLVLTMTFLAILFAMIPAVRRALVGRARLEAGVERMARSLFVSEGLTETRDRTGVLILISRFEHEISILADRGIHAKLPADYWKKLCDEFTSAAGKGEAVEGLCGVIRHVGEELARHFPRSADDKNELPDHLRGGSK
jgi:putative membrane protein